MSIRALITLLVLFAGTLLFQSCSRTKTFYQEGVSIELATYRTRQIYDVKYNLHFHIPEEKDHAIRGTAQIYFKPLKARHGVILDFTPGEELLHQLRVNGDTATYYIMNGHIYIDANNLVPRQENIITIDFTSTDQALNRSEDFMYTLFVPDRASTAFPCFDQPNLKASFELSLDIPEQWNALSNGSEVDVETENGRKTIRFAPGKPISTYLFAFTAGKFEIHSETRNGRTIRLFHRETDKEKLNNNVSTIFNQHFSALQWLEDYTQIEYPYGKFDLALLPGFQYSGMEHPGAIWYRDSRLLLDKNPPLPSKIRKATLIAHETAHMWFGNLVTMQWFDDVWLKEVFAGFMADKIVEKQFPDENHQLQFVLSHYPRAYAIDRTPGTHPIKQELANMKMAGTLYGAIIYNKAPIVFDQLEQIMQPVNFRAAVQEYLAMYAHSNADWNDLVTIFDKHSTQNINQWSNAWVYGKGLPHIQYSITSSKTTHPALTVTQLTAYENNNFPAQLLGVVIKSKNIEFTEDLWFDESITSLQIDKAPEMPCLTMLNGQGKGYGYFEMQETDVRYIMETIAEIENENLRAALYINMFENFLNTTIDSNAFFEFLIKALSHEPQQSLQHYLLGNLRIWAANYPEFEQNTLYQQKTETLLWDKLTEAPAASAEMFFESWIMLARSPESSNMMKAIYEENFTVNNLTISDQNRTQLVLEAAMRNPENTGLLAKERQRIENPDRLRRLNFIAPTVSPDKTERDAFFRQLKRAENRRPEPWVIDALYFLHHPLHPGQGIAYIDESLELLKEIQVTGDIFFPLNWLNATLQNYNDPLVAQKVNQYLEKNPDLQENLRLKVLQASDLIRRSARVK